MGLLQGLLLVCDVVANQLIMLSSIFGIFAIYYFNLINIELLSTKLLIAQLSINMLIVTAVYFVQSLSNIKVLKTK